jgi:PAS domain-containing protein/DNA-binding CsgD family transcriptional regulator
MFEVFDKRAGKHRDFHAWGITPPDEIAYFDEYMTDNPRWLFMPTQRTGDIGWDYRFIDEHGMDRAPFYADLLMRQMDLRYFMSGVLVSTADTYACFSIQRPARYGHIQEAEIALIKGLLPHVQQAFDVGRRLEGAAARGQAAERAFEWLTDGVAIIAADGRVTYANAALMALVRQQDVVRLRQAVLEFVDGSARARFGAALAAVRRERWEDRSTRPPTDFAIAREPDCPPCVVSVRPLVRTDPDGRGLVPNETVVFIHSPLNRRPVEGQMLQDLFGVTVAEAALAVALHAGASPGDYAQTHSVSMNTVYTQLRQLREKTGRHTLRELIQLFDDLAVLVRPLPSAGE